MAKKAELSNSKEGGSDRSIHWAETIATDIEKTGASHDKNEHFDKKQRVRARSEEDIGGKKFSQSDELSLVSLGSEQTSGTFGSEHFADDEISEFEAVLVRELKKRVERQHNQESPKVKNLNSILMKFPQIKEGFEKMRSVFDSVDTDQSGDIDYQEWSDAMDQHGLSVEIPEDQALQVWREADVDGNNLIDFKEFVVVMSFLYLMDYVAVDNTSSPSLTDSTMGRRIQLHQKVKIAIDLVIDAFLFFDRNGDGRIIKKEVMTGLESSDKGSGRRHIDGKHISSNIWRKRFAEMDCDNSGSISLKEFIFAFEDWVGFDESEEDDY